MNKRFRKLAAIVLASAMLLQNGAMILADDLQSETQTEAVQTEPPTEKVTEAPTEPPTEAPTEKVTEAQTEPPTEAPTEAPTEKVTEAPTEKPTEAPTEKVTEAPTEKPTEAPTEKVTEAPTEKQTEAPEESSKKASGKKAKKKDKEETEEQTERSERENDGEKYSADELAKELLQAAPYLFAAGKVTVPDGLLEEQEIAADADGSAVAAALKDFSVELANAKPSSTVQVINLYADEDGKLDTAQLDDQFSDQVIDVTKQYYVVNVIANSADQALSFSGYAMQLSGEDVKYEEDSEPGDILYNFAAMDEEGEFSGYKGNLTLGGTDRLQGTFLAPEAAVTVNADLAGAVYADSVTVSESVEELLPISFVKGHEADAEEEKETSKEEKETSKEEKETSKEEKETSKETEKESEKKESGTEAQSQPEEVEDDADGTEDDSVIVADENTPHPIDTAEPIDEAKPIDDPTSGGTNPQPETGNVTFKDSIKILFDGKPIYAVSGESKLDPYSIVLVKEAAATSPETTTSPEATSSPETTPDPSTSGTQTPEAPKPGQLVFTADKEEGDLTFTGLAPGKYTLQLVDAEGNALQPKEGETVAYPVLRRENKTADAPGTLSFEVTENGSDTVTLLDTGTDGTQEGGLVLDYGSDGTIYPTGFYYNASLVLTKELKDSKGNARNSTETFYAGLFQDENHTQPITETVTDPATNTTSEKPVVLTFSMNGGAAATVTYDKLKATASPMKVYVAETDAQGKVLTEADRSAADLRYAVSITNNGVIEVTAAVPSATAAITNQLSQAVVRFGVMHGGQHLSDVTLVIKDEKGKILSKVDQKKAFLSGSDYLEYTGLLENGNYYLSEVNAPSGYAPAADVPFTVEDGKVTTVTIINDTQQTTDYKLTVEKQVFSGRYQLYAYDPNNNYLGNRTFYVALFQDVDRKIKVSDVKKIVTDKLSTTVLFENLKHNETYFVAETDEYGEVKTAASGSQIIYANDGRVPMDAKQKTEVVQNIYNRRPAGYRYTGTVTVTKRVTTASGAAQKVSETFYVGMYSKADFSDKPNIITLKLENASGASVRRRILLPGENNATYYFAEVDADGNRIDTSDTFAYNVTIDQPSVTVSRGEDKTVTVTNQTKSSKVTLYLTKRVYEGTSLHPVTDTFYLGLFQDAQFTKLYTNPIPLSLKNQSELTLKITLNLGTKDKAVIYIAETDQSGHVIRNESQFGYNIRAVNSTAAFTQQTREIQTIFLNSVYGTATEDDWKEIMSDENNIPSYGGTDGWYGGNGEIDPNVDTTAAQTGDETPIGLYIGLLAAAVIVLIVLLVLKMRKKDRK